MSVIGRRTILLINVLLILGGSGILFFNYHYDELPTVILILGYIVTSIYGLLALIIILLLLFACFIVVVEVLRHEVINGTIENSEENDENPNIMII